MMYSETDNIRTVKDGKTLATRIIAWALVVVTVAAALSTAIYFLIERVKANESDDLYMAVGLVYGTGVDVAFTTTTTTGFTVGSETIEKYEKSFTPLWTLDNTKKISVLGDRNFGKTAFNSYYHSDTDVAVGGYQLQLDAVYADRDALTEAVASVNALLAESGLYAIPSYINGECKIRLGSYADEESATAAIESVTALLPDHTVTVALPTATGVTLVEHATAKILFEYDCGTESFLAVEPIENEGDGDIYLATPAGNIYDGVFVYKRYITDSIDGISLVNVVSLEDYILGVVPYEVSNSWPQESLKAFSIIARTHAVDNLGKYWNKWGFNVDATTATQVYRGAGRVNDNVRKAAADTEGIVMIYGDKLASVFYSSSVGNSNADVRYVWGGTQYPWLQSVETPWEDYLNHTYAFWKTEVSASDLQKYLNSRGYTTLTSPIADITINSYAGENSTYIYQLTVTDEAGNTVTITRSDKVRSAFSSYVKSSNFVVGKGSVDYTVYTELLPPASDPATGTGEKEFSVLTVLGRFAAIFDNGVDVLTSDGTYEGFTGTNGVTVKVAGGDLETIVGEKTTYTETRTAYASDSGNFIFVGKGWGHGVGYSQWGIYDLCKMGYDYESILLAYCPETEAVHYKKVLDYYKDKVTSEETTETDQTVSTDTEQSDTEQVVTEQTDTTQ